MLFPFLVPWLTALKWLYLIATPRCYTSFVSPEVVSLCSFMTFLPMSAVLMLHALDQYSRMMYSSKPEMLSLHSM